MRFSLARSGRHHPRLAALGRAARLEACRVVDSAIAVGAALNGHCCWPSVEGSALTSAGL